jgi:hypothetical protein
MWNSLKRIYGCSVKIRLHTLVITLIMVWKFLSVGCKGFGGFIRNTIELFKPMVRFKNYLVIAF